MYECTFFVNCVHCSTMWTTLNSFNSKCFEIRPIPAPQSKTKNKRWKMFNLQLLNIAWWNLREIQCFTLYFFSYALHFLFTWLENSEHSISKVTYQGECFATLQLVTYNFFHLKKKMFQDIFIFYFWWIQNLQNLWRDHQHYCTLEVTFSFCFFRIHGSIIMKFDQKFIL